METTGQHETAPSSETAGHPAPVPSLRRSRVQFTGTGAEYFRIWIVNLLLTIVTLGIYSAWAKVRKLQYFYRNTRLDDSGFDYHGNPVAILKGRIVAVALLVLYNFSQALLGPYAGFAALGLMALLPWLLTQSYRFRLHNSSYRGLRFRFSGPVSQAYLIFGLPMIPMFAPGVLTGVGAFGDARHPGVKFFIVLGLAIGSLVLLWPYLHYRFKRWQHGNASYGTARARFLAGAGAFYLPYLAAVAILLAAAVPCALSIWAISSAAPAAGGHAQRAGAGLAIMVGVFALMFYAASLAAAPIVNARIQNAVWSGTRLETVRFASDVGAARLVGITFTNLLMVVFSLGLLIPFAVIRAMKYRLESIEVLDADALAQIGRDGVEAQVGATGEGAMDVMDLDFGL